MAATTYNLHVEMADGTTWEVTADQRDVARFEVQPFGCSVLQAITRPYTFARFLAWSAGKRAGKHVLSWEQFDAAALDVDSVEAPDPDPTNPEASAGPSSS